jgi:ketosteroid isomerase-like protein
VGKAEITAAYMTPDINRTNMKIILLTALLFCFFGNHDEAQNKNKMDVKTFIQEFIAAGNAYDTKRYLDMWQKDAVLEDKSIKQVYKGQEGVKKYFEKYFVKYKTQTRLIKLNVINDHQANIDVQFTSYNQTGTFDFIFKDGKIASAIADFK